MRSRCYPPRRGPWRDHHSSEPRILSCPCGSTRIKMRRVQRAGLERRVGRRCILILGIRRSRPGRVRRRARRPFEVPKSPGHYPSSLERSATKAAQTRIGRASSLLDRDRLCIRLHDRVGQVVACIDCELLRENSAMAFVGALAIVPNQEKVYEYMYR